MAEGGAPHGRAPGHALIGSNGRASRGIAMHDAAKRIPPSENFPRFARLRCYIRRNPNERLDFDQRSSTYPRERGSRRGVRMCLVVVQGDLESGCRSFILHTHIMGPSVIRGPLSLREMKRNRTFRNMRAG